MLQNVTRAPTETGTWSLAAERRVIYPAPQLRMATLEEALLQLRLGEWEGGCVLEWSWVGHFYSREQLLQRSVLIYRGVEEEHCEARRRKQCILALQEYGPMGPPGRNVSASWIYKSGLWKKWGLEIQIQESRVVSWSHGSVWDISGTLWGACTALRAWALTWGPASEEPCPGAGTGRGCLYLGRRFPFCSLVPVSGPGLGLGRHEQLHNCHVLRMLVNGEITSKSHGLITIIFIMKRTPFVQTKFTILQDTRGVSLPCL